MERTLRGLVTIAALGACEVPASNDQAGVPPGTAWARWDGERPRQLVGDFASAGATPEAAARSFLDRNGPLLGLDGVELALEQTRRGRAGSYLRFGQRAAGLPVFDAHVVVLVDYAVHVRSVNLSQRAPVGRLGRDQIGAPGATGAALAALGLDAAQTGATLGVAQDGTLVYRVT